MVEPKYAEYGWTLAKIQAIQKDLKSASACRQQQTIEELKMSVQRWTKWWMGIMITLLGLLCSIAVMAWAAAERVTKMEGGLDNVEDKVTDVSDTVDRVVSTQQEIKTSLEGRKDSVIENEESLKEIKEAIQDLAKKGKRW